MSMEIQNKPYERNDYGVPSPASRENREAGEKQASQTCTTNTDKPDSEIGQLKQKKLEIEKKLQAASGDDKKIARLEKDLARVQNELNRKDNDGYRRQNSSVQNHVNVLL